MERIVEIFKALSSNVRLEILSLLAEGPLCVNALVGRLSISQPAVSQHLKILENAGLVKGNKMGYHVHYSLVPESLVEGFSFLEKFRRRDDMGKEKCHKGKKPGECAPEQIKKCHGDVKEHPCEEPECKGKTKDK